MPKAYVVAEVVVHDPVQYQAYREKVLPNIQASGGQFLVRGGQRVQCEGLDDAHHDQIRTIILEFPSLEEAREWYDSAAYAELKLLRQAASQTRMFIVEGA